MSGVDLQKPDPADESAVYDRVVIGAGIIGSCAAYQLMQAGHRRVLLLDQVRPARPTTGLSRVKSQVRRTIISHLNQCDLSQVLFR